MKKTLIVDTLSEKSIEKAFIAIHKIAYNLNFKQVSKLKLSDLNVSGSKIFSTKHNINTLGDIAKLNIIELKALKGIGPKAVLSVQDTMINNNINFKIIPKKKAVKAKVVKAIK